MSTLRLLAGLLFVIASVGNALGFLPDAERLLADMLELTLIGWYSLTNLVTVIPLVILIFFSYPRSLLDVLRRR